MKRKYILAILIVGIVLMLRVCLSNDKKKTDVIIPSAVTDVKTVEIQPLQSSLPRSVNPAVFGVNIGFAFKRELDKDSGFVQLLREMHPHSLRFPGGTVANYYHPDLPVYGYKREEIPFGLGTLYVEQSKRQENILYNFIRLAKAVNCGVVYCANVYTGTTQEILFVLKTLQENQIPVLGVELGNEFCLMEYRKKFPDAGVYIQKIQSTASAIRKQYPSLPIVVIAGDGVPASDQSGRGKFMRGWNQRLAKETFYDAYTWHPYKDCPACDKAEQFDELYLRNFDALAPYRSNYLEQLRQNYLPVFGKQRSLWLTEWNIGNLKFLDNTFLQAAYVFEQYLQMIDLNVRHNNYFAVSNVHALDGFITAQQGKMTPLLSRNKNMATVQYFAFQYLASTLDTSKRRAAEKVTITDPTVAQGFICQTYADLQSDSVYVYFLNRSGQQVQLRVQDQHRGKVRFQAIESAFPYATAGKTFFEKEYPEKLKPVSRREEHLTQLNFRLAPYAFGYLVYARDTN